MKIGLVLAGGEKDEIYQLGVWKALKELKTDKYIKVFSGASVGAINAILFAQDDLKKAEILHSYREKKKFLHTDMKNIILKYIKKDYKEKNIENCDVVTDKFKRFINEELDIDKIKSKDMICYTSHIELPDSNLKYFKINDYKESIAKNIILASASLPIVYKNLSINKNYYLNYEMVKDIPIQPVYDEGCDMIIVVSLSKDLYIDKAKFPNARIVEIKPVNLNEEILAENLEFDFQAKKRLIREGYLDAVKILTPILYIKELEIINNIRDRYLKINNNLENLKNLKNKDIVKNNNI